MSSLGIHLFADGSDTGPRCSVSTMPSHATRPGVRATSVSLPGITYSGCICPWLFLAREDRLGTIRSRSTSLRSATNAADRHRNVARPSEGYILTSRRDWHIVVLDLAIEDVRARVHRGTPGRLGGTKVVSEAPFPGAKLITRRASVPWAGALQERIKVADRVDLRLSFRTIDLQAGSSEVGGPINRGQRPLTPFCQDPKKRAEDL